MPEPVASPRIDECAHRYRIVTSWRDPKGDRQILSRCDHCADLAHGRLLIPAGARVGVLNPSSEFAP